MLTNPCRPAAGLGDLSARFAQTAKRRQRVRRQQPLGLLHERSGSQPVRPIWGNRQRCCRERFKLRAELLVLLLERLQVFHDLRMGLLDLIQRGLAIAQQSLEFGGSGGGPKIAPRHSRTSAPQHAFRLQQ